MTGRMRVLQREDAALRVLHVGAELGRGVVRRERYAAAHVPREGTLGARRGGGVGACTSTSICTRVPARTLAHPITRRPSMSESHSEMRVLEYPSSTPFSNTKGYLRVLRYPEDGPTPASGALLSGAACMSSRAWHDTRTVAFHDVG